MRPRGLRRGRRVEGCETLLLLEEFDEVRRSGDAGPTQGCAGRRGRRKRRAGGRPEEDRRGNADDARKGGQPKTMRGARTGGPRRDAQSSSSREAARGTVRD